jgi:hypothetical protein
MKNPHLDSEIASRIQSFLDELSGLVKRQALEAVHEALGGAAAPARRGPGRPRKVSMRPGRKPRMIAKRGKRVRRSLQDLEKIAAQVLAHVKANAGHRLEQIGKAIKADTAVLKRPVALLLASKKLKTTGKKRGTKYFVR